PVARGKLAPQRGNGVLRRGDHGVTVSMVPGPRSYAGNETTHPAGGSEVRQRGPVDVAGRVIAVCPAIGTLAPDGHVARGSDRADRDRLRLGLLVQGRGHMVGVLGARESVETLFQLRADTPEPDAGHSGSPRDATVRVGALDLELPLSERVAQAALLDEVLIT